MKRLALAIVACAMSGTLSAQDVTYMVTLRVITDDPLLAAEQLATTHGATVTEPVTGRTFSLQLSPSRAGVLVADPRVESVVPQSRNRGLRAATNAIDWNNGISYTYDGAGNIKTIGSDAFVYDAAGRLIQADTNGIRRTYTYDAAGNRTACTHAPGTSAEGDCQFGLTINASTNRINSVGYDSAGNVTSMSGHTYTYDALNMQTSDNIGAQVREYLYTASDERIATYTVGQHWRWTIRDTAGKILREFTSYNDPNGSLGTASWQWTKDYIWRDGLLLASRQNVSSSLTSYHYHLDHLGTPRRITDGSDQIVGRHDYLAFGPETSDAQNEPSFTALKYTSHERDLVSGGAWDLDYMHARYYSPALGRFLSVDKSRGNHSRPQSLNRYTYALNNPVNRVDPDGNCSVPTGLSQGQVGICIESFIASLTVGGIGRGDHRTFAANDPELKNRMQTQLIVDPSAQRILGMDRSAGVSGVILKSFGGEGSNNSTITDIASGTSGLSFTLTASGTNWWRDNFNVGPKGSIMWNLKFEVSKSGAVGIAKGSAITGYPSTAIYAYRITPAGLVVDTLLEHNETTTKDLGVLGWPLASFPPFSQYRTPAGACIEGQPACR
jgi:RHS repeat-associated protein